MGRQRSRGILQARKMPDSAGDGGNRDGLGCSPTSVKPSLRGTPSLARLARSWWISTTSIPGRVKAAVVSAAEAALA